MGRNSHLVFTAILPRDHTTQTRNSQYWQWLGKSLDCNSLTHYLLACLFLCDTESPPIGWPAAAYVLLGREDLALSYLARSCKSKELETQTNVNLISMSCLEEREHPDSVLPRRKPWFFRSKEKMASWNQTLNSNLIRVQYVE